MNHLPFIAAAYAVTIVAVLAYAVAAILRLGRARRMLTAAEAARR